MPEPQVDASLLAALDQASAGGTGRAQTLGQFFRRLLSEGFERAEAMELVRDYFECLQSQQEAEE